MPLAGFIRLPQEFVHNRHHGLFIFKKSPMKRQVIVAMVTGQIRSLYNDPFNKQSKLSHRPLRGLFLKCACLHLLGEFGKGMNPQPADPYEFRPDIIDHTGRLNGVFLPVFLTTQAKKHIKTELYSSAADLTPGVNQNFLTGTFSMETEQVVGQLKYGEMKMRTAPLRLRSIGSSAQQS